LDRPGGPRAQDAGDDAALCPPLAGHQLDAVRRLDGERTGTGTEERVEKAVAGGSAEVVEQATETNGGGLDRTADVGIMSEIERDPEEPD
jgi:hypothetical protein